MRILGSHYITQIINRKYKRGWHFLLLEKNKIIPKINYVNIICTKVITEKKSPWGFSYLIKTEYKV